MSLFFEDIANYVGTTPEIIRLMVSLFSGLYLGLVVALITFMCEVERRRQTNLANQPTAKTPSTCLSEQNG